MSDDDELTESERAELAAWAPLAPPRDFADRVLAARATPPARRGRWPLVAGAAAVAVAAAVAAIVVTRDRDRSAAGELVAATVRTTRTLGDRAVAVAEPEATLAWRIDTDGDASVEQRAGSVFYRVDPGGAFVVHTPAGDVRVTGTCFRVEVIMNRTKQLVLSGAIGAAVAAGIVVTVYEGHVVADSKTGQRTEVVAGQRATIEADGRSAIAPDRTATIAALDDSTATREQLVARTRQQQTEIARLRSRVAELEDARGGAHHDNGAETGRAWYDPSPERLAAWAAECHVRSDEPGLDRWEPAKALGKNELGLEPGELEHVNAALAEVQRQWKALVRALYIEATGDVQGADTLSIDAMRGEIQEKGTEGEHSALLQRVAQERAGLAQPPADLSKTSPFERMFRAYITLGDKSEQAIAKRLGAERAKQLRGDGWGSRSDWSGCPNTD